jgi:hypothetical protein
MVSRFALPATFGMDRCDSVELAAESVRVCIVVRLSGWVENAPTSHGRRSRTVTHRGVAIDGCR